MPGYLLKKGENKVFVKTKQLSPDEMENMYGWKICDGKLEPNWFEGPAVPSFEEINQEQNILDSLPDLNQARDTSTLDSDEETDGLYISDENND